MTDTQVSPDREQLDDAARVAPSERGSTRRFRGATYEDAIDAATDELGADIHVLEANRIRRGGLGGFFATDLGVEVTVTTEELSDGPIDGARGAVGLDETDEIDASAIRPYLPEDLTTDRADGALPGQSLGMTDARLEQLLDRANRTEREQLPRRRPSAALSSFADQYADEVRFADAETRSAAALTGPIRLVDEASATPVDTAQRIDGRPADEHRPGEQRAEGHDAGAPFVPERPMVEDAAPEQSTAEQPTAEQSTAEQATAEQATAEHAAAERLTAEQPTMSEASAGPATHVPMVRGDDRPRLPAMSLAAVARRAPTGFLDAYPPQADADPVADTDTDTCPEIAEIADADIGVVTSGDSPGTGADARPDALHDSVSDDDDADDVDPVSGDRPIAETQDLMIDVSAGMVHGTVNEVVPGTADETTRDMAQATVGAAPVIGPASDRAIDPGRAIDQSAPLDQHDSPASSTLAVVAGDVEAPSSMMGSTWMGSTSMGSPLIGAPTLPSDPTMPMVGTMRSSARDVPAAAPSLADGDQVHVGIEGGTAVGTGDGTPAAVGSGHPVAVVVPMSQSIDEPMNRIVAPPRLETGADVAGRPEKSTASPRIGERLTADVVGAGSPSDVIGGPIVLGGPEFPYRSSGLVAEATDRLLSQLDHLAAGDGGLTDLDRVRVAVTSTDGSRIEMAVERGNGHD